MTGSHRFPESLSSMFSATYAYGHPGGPTTGPYTEGEETMAAIAPASGERAVVGRMPAAVGSKHCAGASRSHQTACHNGEPRRSDSTNSLGREPRHTDPRQLVSRPALLAICLRDTPIFPGRTGNLGDRPCIKDIEGPLGEAGQMGQKRTKPDNAGRPDPSEVREVRRGKFGGSSGTKPELRCANPYLKSIDRPDQAPVAAAFGSGSRLLGPQPPSKLPFESAHKLFISTKISRQGGIP